MLKPGDKHDPEKWEPVFGKDHAQTDDVQPDFIHSGERQ